MSDVFVSENEWKKERKQEEADRAAADRRDAAVRELVASSEKLYDYNRTATEALAAEQRHRAAIAAVRELDAPGSPRASE